MLGLPVPKISNTAKVKSHFSTQPAAIGAIAETPGPGKNWKVFTSSFFFLFFVASRSLFVLPIFPTLYICVARKYVEQRGGSLPKTKTPYETSAGSQSHTE